MLLARLLKCITLGDAPDKQSDGVSTENQKEENMLDIGIVTYKIRPEGNVIREQRLPLMVFRVVTRLKMEAPEKRNMLLRYLMKLCRVEPDKVRLRTH